MNPTGRMLARALLTGLAATLGGSPAGCSRAPSEPSSTPTTEAAPHAAQAPGRGRASDDAAMRERPAFAFTDVTTATGLDFTPVSGATPSTQILEVKGGGLALIDFDRDGDLDLFVPNGATLDAPGNGPGSRLFENIGNARAGDDGGRGNSLGFVDATDRLGIDLKRWAMGVAVGDYDDDGFDDLYVTCHGPNVLLHNEGGARFRDVTESAGVGDGSWSTAAAFGDLDGDGDLDLYVANYLAFDPAQPPPPSRFRDMPVLAGPRGLVPQPDVLYENLGEGRWRDASVASGIRAVEPSYGLGAAILDLDGDGRLDVLVGNDSMPNFQFRAAEPGTLRFEDVAGHTGLAANGAGSPQATMGIAVADVDDNGRPDVFTTNFASDTNTLHLGAAGGPHGFFDDGTSRFGLGMTSYQFLGWACAFADLDHDGDEDLLAFNGHVYPDASVETMDSPYLQTPLLFRREARRFERVLPDAAMASDAAASGLAWLAAAHCDRGAVFGDLDRDGDLDIVVRELNGPLRVLRNDRDGGAWIVVAPERPIGCVVTISDPASSRIARRWLVGGAGFLSASAFEAHAALPGAEHVDVTVRWPDGTTATRTGVSVGSRVEVTRP